MQLHLNETKESGFEIDKENNSENITINGITYSVEVTNRKDIFEIASKAKKLQKKVAEIVENINFDEDYEKTYGKPICNIYENYINEFLGDENAVKEILEVKSIKKDVDVLEKIVNYIALFVQSVSDSRIKTIQNKYGIT